MLIDTSGFLCVHDERERHTKLGRKHYASRGTKITTNYVLAEYSALALVRGLPRRKVFMFCKAILDDPKFETVWVSEDLHRRGVELLNKRLDKTYSLCDAVSFLIMRDRGIADALTTDKHFEQEGFNRLLK